MDKTQVKQTYEVFSKLQFVTLNKYIKGMVISTEFYDRHHDLVDRYGISLSQITTDMFHLS